MECGGNMDDLLGLDFADFDRFCDEHDIQSNEGPSAFAAWLYELTGWDGPMNEVEEDTK